MAWPSACASAPAGSPAPPRGWPPGNVQANLAILPAALAHDFLRFAQANPKPCPVLAVSEPGAATLPTLAGDLDIRTDVPRYRVWRHGEVVEEPTDIRRVWRDDLVTFAIGCSFSFEEALLEDGIEVRHITLRLQRADVPHQHPDRAGRRVPRAAGGVDAAAEAGGRHPGGADHFALSLGARRAGASRHARGDRHPRPGQAGLRRCGAGRAGRVAGVLGLRGDAASGDRGR